MEASYTSKDLWESAGLAGLSLGAVSTAYLAIGQLLSFDGASVGLSVVGSVLSFILWIAKFAGCILLMRYFMKKFCATFPGTDSRDSFKLGACSAFLSALVYSAAYFAFASFISPDMIAAQMDEVISTYSSMLDSNSLAALESMTDNFAKIAFFSNLIYCSLFGIILSAILSRNIPSRDPFAHID